MNKVRGIHIVQFLLLEILQHQRYDENRPLYVRWVLHHQPTGSHDYHMTSGHIVFIAVPNL